MLPNYASLQVFGSSCFPFIRPSNRHKLQFRLTKCVFLGYSSMHKGYLCFDRLSSLLYITHDVVFNEFAFPFASSSLSTPIPSPIFPSEDTFSLPFTELFSSSSPTHSSQSTPPLSITLSPTSPQFF